MKEIKLETKISLPCDPKMDLEILHCIFSTIIYHRALGKTSSQEYSVSSLDLPYVSSPDEILQDRISSELRKAYSSLQKNQSQNHSLEIRFSQKITTLGMMGAYETTECFEKWVIPLHFFKQWTQTAERVHALRDQLRQVLFNVIQAAQFKAIRKEIPHLTKDQERQSSPVVFPFEISVPAGNQGLLQNLLGSFI